MGRVSFAYGSCCGVPRKKWGFTSVPPGIRLKSMNIQSFQVLAFHASAKKTCNIRDTPEVQPEANLISRGITQLHTCPRGVHLHTASALRDIALKTSREGRHSRARWTVFPPARISKLGFRSSRVTQERGGARVGCV